MSDAINRRHFLGAAAAAGLALQNTTASAAVQQNPSERVVVGIIGTGGRGTGLAGTFARQRGVEVGYVCDVDQTRAERAGGAVQKAGGAAPRVVNDFRRMLDDNNLNAVVVATCNHWHAPATILACSAGKHVYVEKPCSHNPREGELMITAARKNKCHVQMGNQRRSYEKIIEGIEEVRKGTIGRAYYAQSYYLNLRPSIGKGEAGPPPKGLDWDLWQGPAPRRPFRSNYHPYNWHWFWHWGTGELGNNGIHALDVCRWGLKVDYPLRITSGGGKYFYNDDQETPDTHTVTYDFGDKGITWEGRNWHRRGFEGSMFGIAFYGDQGTMIIDGGKYLILDPQGKEVTQANGSSDDRQHLQNFLDCIRNGKRPNADIEDGHKSTLLCHLGNIAYRVGRTINLDSKTYKIVGDAEAHRLWTREYRSGWEPRV